MVGQLVLAADPIVPTKLPSLYASALYDELPGEVVTFTIPPYAPVLVGNPFERFVRMMFLEAVTLSERLSVLPAPRNRFPWVWGRPPKLKIGPGKTLHSPPQNTPT